MSGGKVPPLEPVKHAATQVLVLLVFTAPESNMIPAVAAKGVRKALTAPKNHAHAT